MEGHKTRGHSSRAVSREQAFLVMILGKSVINCLTKLFPRHNVCFELRLFWWLEEFSAPQNAIQLRLTVEITLSNSYWLHLKKRKRKMVKQRIKTDERWRNFILSMHTHIAELSQALNLLAFYCFSSNPFPLLRHHSTQVMGAVWPRFHVSCRWWGHFWIYTHEHELSARNESTRSSGKSPSSDESLEFIVARLSASINHSAASTKSCNLFNWWIARVWREYRAAHVPLCRGQSMNSPSLTHRLNEFFHPAFMNHSATRWSSWPRNISAGIDDVAIHLTRSVERKYAIPVW